MNPFGVQLTKNNTIITLFILFIAFSIGFLLWIPYVGGSILDELYRRDDILQLLGTMSEEQKHSHFLMTIILDTPYPFIASFLTIGVTLKFSRNNLPFLLLPAVLLIPIDLMENMIQLQMLSGNMEFISHKYWLTPLKLWVFFLAFIIAANVWWRRVRVKKQ